MARKKDKKTLMVIVLIALAIGAFFFVKGCDKDEGVTDQGIELKVNVYDENGQLIDTLSISDNLLQSTVSIGGGTEVPRISFISITSTIENIGETEVTITDIMGGIIGRPADTIYQTAIDSVDGYTSTSFTLQPQETNVQTTDLMDIRTLPYGSHEFRLTTPSTFKDAQGGDVPISPSPVGTVVVTLSADICPDGTLEGQCVENGLGERTGQRCVGGTFVDDAGTCTCPPLHENVNDVCEHIQCADGTLAGQCITDGTGYTAEYCDSTGNQIPGCGASLCGGATTACSDDYYGNQATCFANQCEYQSYSADLSIGLG